MNPEQSKSKTQNYILAAIVSLIIVCVGLAFVANQINNNETPEDTDQLEKSDYPVKPFASAAETLEIETINQWTVYPGEGFTITLPERLEIMSDDEFQAMMEAANYAQPDDSQFYLMALDADATLNGVNITLNSIKTTGGMTPDNYVTGTANEFEAAQYTVDDVSAYELGGNRVGRLIYSRPSTQAGSLTGVQFAFIQNRTIWVVTGTGVSAEFEDWLPIFEAIAREFEIN